MSWWGRGLASIVHKVPILAMVAAIVVVGGGVEFSTSVQAFATNVSVRVAPGLEVVMSVRHEESDGPEKRDDAPEGDPILINLLYGNVFPGESLKKDFTVTISGDNERESEREKNPKPKPKPKAPVTYNVISMPKVGFLSLSPFLSFVRDPAEVGEPADSPNCASMNPAAGDASDKWLVTLTLPDSPAPGDYGAEVKVEQIAVCP